MERKNLLTLFGSICLVLVLAALLLPACAKPAPPVPTPPVAPAPAPKPAPAPPKPPEAKLPEVISIASFAEGASGYAMASGLREGIEQITPMKVRVESFTTDLARFMALRLGDVEFVHVGSGGTLCALGMFDFASPEWGPLPVRQAFRGNDIFIGFFVLGDSPIQTAADLRGKRVMFYPGTPTTTSLVEGNLAFANLTWDDVIKVPVAGYAKGTRAAQEGICDVSYASTTTAGAVEAAASPRGMRWLESPASDVEGWKRSREKCFFVGPGLAWKGANCSPEDPKEIPVYPYTLYTFDKTPEEVVYAAVKALDEGYDIFKDMHVDLPEYTLERTADLSIAYLIPYHTATIKYLKEKGMWTSEDEEWQKARLAEEKARMDEFKADPKAWGQKWGTK